MEDGDEIVVDNQIPTQAEKNTKFLRDTAELLICTARIPPHGFVQHLGPYLPFRVSQLERQVLKIHKERKDKVKKFLKNFQGKLTISYDLVAHDDEWDNSYSIDFHKDFVCMSAHFVDHKCKVGKWILGYYPIEYVRGEKVALYRIKNIIHDYEIEDKVSALLVSNYRGLGRKAFDCFRKWIEKKRGKISNNPFFFRIYCCSDLFRLMARDLFGNMDSLLEDIRVMVGWGKMTSTNWNVSLCNLQGALDMEDKNVFAEDEYYQEFDQPSDEDWIMIRTFCKLGGCIYKVAKELFEGEYSTSNLYFHLLAELKVMLNQELASGDTKYFRRKAKKILKRFDKYWKIMFLVLATASVLDPRFKMKYLQFYCSKEIANHEGSKAETVLDY
ncbi:Zinc finger BED domain-containing protein RICESLEEPER 3 [Cardamine amara subsp. amara]|uniref:Zinc finger BED domain-containing protein RICESLEEPER 3 n=1 Tax=Cardamine amara subsp. amara TaxID=228776 RepID=A0ABD1ASE7_CARAN